MSGCRSPTTQQLLATKARVHVGASLLLPCHAQSIRRTNIGRSEHVGEALFKVVDDLSLVERTDRFPRLAFTAELVLEQTLSTRRRRRGIRGQRRITLMVRRGWRFERQWWPRGRRQQVTRRGQRIRVPPQRGPRHRSW